MTALDLKTKKRYYNLCDPSKPAKDSDSWFVNIDAQGKANART